MNRRSFLGQAVSAVRTPPRPNLLWIVADEWRGQALPFAGDPNLRLPNLTRLAREGVSCSRAYTCYPVCCPSRAAMLTGRLPQSVGVRRNHTQLPLEHETVSAVLRRNGYRTGYIGKWHLDGGESSGFVPPERRRGFDYWAAYNLAHKHFDGEYFRDTPEPIRTTGFEGDYQTALAMEFLRQPSREPFFLYLSWVAPHSPFTPPAKYDTYDPARLRLRANVPPGSQAEARKLLAGYYGLCDAVDANLGRLVNALDAQGLARDTIVLFTSDHGETLGSHGIDEIDVPYEEAVRIPLVLRYPRRIRPGRVHRGLVSNIDLAPTLLSWCGVPVPAVMEGAGQSGILAGTGGRGRQSVSAEGAVGQPEQWRMIVLGRHKFVAGPDKEPKMLFDLEHDPYEMQNLAGQRSNRRLLGELQSLL